MTNDAEALNTKGVSAGKKGNNLLALKYFKKAVSLDPTHITALTNIAMAYKNIGKFKSAINSYDNALILDPSRAKTHGDLGNVYFAMGKLKTAVKWYKKALELDPNNAEIHCNLGTTYADLGRYEKAVESLKTSIGLDPTIAEAYYNLGYVFQNNSNYKEAIFFFNETLKNNPDIDLTYPHLYFMLRHVCDWKFEKDFNRKLDELYQKSMRLKEMPAETPFISFTRSENPEINFNISRAWAKKYTQNKKAFTLTRRKMHKKLKIGYVSDAFYDFPTAHNITDVLRHHDKSEFEIYIYSHGPDDNSFWRKAVKKAVYKFRDIKKLSDQKVAELIVNDNIDILVDLKGHMRGSRLGIFAYKPAPVSASWIGFPATTGADFIDYIIADKIVIPEGHKKYYSEKVLYLPNCYRTPDTATQITKKQMSRKSLGLPEKAFVYCSFNSAYKITPEVFNVWMNILKRVPDSVLWILVKNEMARKNILRETNTRGVISKRIIFADKLPKSEHLKRISLADLALDTHPVNGHTTTTDCLRVDIPVITMLGGHFSSRVSASCLRSMGLTELIAKNLQDYEDLAVELATKPKSLLKLKRKLKENKSTYPLFNIKNFTKDLESLYRRIYSSL